MKLGSLGEEIYHHGVFYHLFFLYFILIPPPPQQWDKWDITFHDKQVTTQSTVPV